SGGGQPGSALRCKPGGPNDYAYVIIQPQGWAPLMKIVGREELIEHPDYATPKARLSRLDECFGIIEQWTRQHDKFEVMRILNEVDVPCGPILDMKDLIEDASLAARGTVVEVDHPTRGPFTTVGCPIKLSESPVEVITSPALGEHTEDVLRELGYGDNEIENARAEGAI
ncbi:MAG TPA: CoA transferase, partial [Dongiaceae bacterium]|nr:CoA transferase [Dongiaceae bacterium]